MRSCACCSCFMSFCGFTIGPPSRCRRHALPPPHVDDLAAEEVQGLLDRRLPRGLVEHALALLGGVGGGRRRRPRPGRLDAHLRRAARGLLGQLPVLVLVEGGHGREIGRDLDDQASPCSSRAVAVRSGWASDGRDWARASMAAEDRRRAWSAAADGAARMRRRGAGGAGGRGGRRRRGPAWARRGARRGRSRQRRPRAGRARGQRRARRPGARPSPPARRTASAAGAAPPS